MRLFLSLYVIFLALPLYGMGRKPDWNKAIDRAISRHASHVEPSLRADFARAKIMYPPKEIALLTFKSERQIELWARNKSDKWLFIRKYPLTAYSGNLGPKLREHDKQIPEGIYKLTHFNPFSSMHLSMKLNYPNAFDKAKGQKDGRKHLGDDIYIHGKNKSVGCLAVGNTVIDQLFVLAHRVGLKNTQIIIAPQDFRHKQIPKSKPMQPVWVHELYHQIASALKPFKTAKKSVTS